MLLMQRNEVKYPNGLTYGLKMSYTVIKEGKYRVAALTAVKADWTLSECPALQFLQEMHGNKNYVKSCIGFVALMDRWSELGQAGMTSATMHEANKENSILELIKGDLRLLCFVENGTIYLTNGYIKKSQGADPKEVRRAIDARTAFIAAKSTRSKK
jgi:hypothetical protein